MHLARIGRFEIERVLGSGGFATVWLARDTDLDSLVAIKVLAENWSLDEDARRRFTEEARSMRRLDSDRIVRVFEVVTLSDGRPGMVMEFADGGSLQDRIRQRLGFRQPFAVHEAIDLSVEIARCLGAVHRLGIVHRDLKPSNVLFKRRVSEARGERTDPAERAMLADFGIARSLEATATTGRVVGSPAYMAPEQADPDRGTPVDARADIYAAAAVLYELLAGHVPYGHESIESARAGARDLRPLRQARPDAPESLERVVARGLARDPDDRFALAGEWEEGLRAALEGEPPEEPGGRALELVGVGAPVLPAGGSGPSGPVTPSTSSDRTRSPATRVMGPPDGTALLPAEGTLQPATARPRRRGGPAAGLMLAAAVAVVVGSLVPWTRLPGGLESTGVAGTGGLLALGAGVVAIAAALGMLWTRERGGRAGAPFVLAGALAGLAAFLVALSEFPRVRNELLEIFGQRWGSSHPFTALPGVYVTLAGGLICLACAVSVVTRRPWRTGSSKRA